MSVIIRLQNLPWSANSLDIRQYFKGLSIPEGGVHIVGGEQGDAFIAFSTDEDARQAMILDGGKIKEVRIKLFLSSRTEMQKVIETARQQTLALQGLLPMNSPFSSTQSMNGPVPCSSPNQNSVMSSDNAALSDIKDEKERGKRPERSRSREKKKDRDRERDRRFRRDRSKSRSKSRDRFRRRSRSRDRRDRRKRDDREKFERDKHKDDDFSKRDGDRLGVQLMNGRNDIGTNEGWNFYTKSQGRPGLLPSPTKEQIKNFESRDDRFVESRDRIRAEWGPPTNDQFCDSVTSEIYSQGLGFGFNRMVGPEFIDNNAMMNVYPGAGGFRNEDFLANRMHFDERHGLLPKPLPIFDDANLIDQSERNDFFSHGDSSHMQSQRFGDVSAGRVRGNGKPRRVSRFEPIKSASESETMESDGLNENSDSIPSTCIELRNLPLKATTKDIRDFFKKMGLTVEGSKMVLDNQGKRTGLAYVQFCKGADRDIALQRSWSLFQGESIDILPLSESVYHQTPSSDVEDNVQSERRESLIVSLRGLPAHCNEESLLKFLSGFHTVDTVIELDKDRRCSGLAYVRFSSASEAKEAINKLSNQTLSHCYIRLNASTSEAMEKCRRDMKGHSVGLLPEPQDSPITDCVIMRGLPATATDREVVDFYSDVGLCPIRIHVMLDRFGAPSGDAFCEFATTEDVRRAISKNGSFLGNHRISVCAVARREMESALGVVNTPQSNILEAPVSTPEFTTVRPRFPARPVPGQGLLGHAPQMVMNRPRGSYIPGPPRMHGPSNIDSIVSSGGSSSIDNFGRPGCVVALENVPFKASIDELIDFFDGYDVTKENIIRRYNEKGQPTGDARVAFSNPSLAQRAIRELNQTTIRNRPIYMFLI